MNQHPPHLAGTLARLSMSHTGPDHVARRVRALHRSALAAVSVVFLTLLSAPADVVLPGATEALEGTTTALSPQFGGTVLRDKDVAFLIKDAGGTEFLTGTLQDRLIRSNTLGTLVFSYRLHDLSGSPGAPNAVIIGVVRDGFRGVATDVEYMTDAIGTVGPNSVTRASDGDQLAFAHNPNLLVVPDDSRFTVAVTNAPDYDVTGKITIYAKKSSLAPDVFSTTIEGVAVPGVLNVNPGQSIQFAIDHAALGEAVIVAPGTYHEELTLRSWVDVIGAGAGKTILEPAAGTGVTATGVTEAEFSGFTVRPATSSTATTGIHVDGGNPMLRGNHVTGFPRYGVKIVNGSTAFVCGNRLEKNFDGGNAFSDYNLIVLNSTPVVANNLIVTGEVGCYIGWHESDGMHFLNNTVVHNVWEGVWCYSSNPVIKNNLVTGNGSGISATHDFATPVLSYNDVWNNLVNYDAQSTGVIVVGPGSISLNPLYNGSAPGDYLLGDDSPCIDAGDPAEIYNDLNGSRNDIGYTGGPCGSPIPPGALVSGFVWVAVGTYPTADLHQGGPKRGMTIERDRPFGGSPWLFGAFGVTETAIFRYAVQIAPWSGGTPPAPGDFQYLDEPLSKVRYDISGGVLKSERVAIGPVDYFGKPAYSLTINSGNTFWAHQDLRLVLNTLDLPNGVYSVRMVPLAVGGTPVPLTVNNDLILHVNNSRPEVAIDSITYQNGDPIAECSIVRLPSATTPLIFTYTASHPEGFLDNYELGALVGTNRAGGTIVADDYSNHVSIGGSWPGVTVTPVVATPSALPLPNLQLWETCAYQFRISAWARTTNGFGRLYWTTFFENHAIDLTPPVIVRSPDLDGDGDVDGDDLNVFAGSYGTSEP